MYSRHTYCTKEKVDEFVAQLHAMGVTNNDIVIVDLSTYNGDYSNDNMVMVSYKINRDFM